VIILAASCDAIECFEPSFLELNGYPITWRERYPSVPAGARGAKVEVTGIVRDALPLDGGKGSSRKAGAYTRPLLSST
jgi:hypothetical protein